MEFALGSDRFVRKPANIIYVENAGLKAPKNRASAFCSQIESQKIHAPPAFPVMNWNLKFEAVMFEAALSKENYCTSCC
jgi:hypothetical protein